MGGDEDEDDDDFREFRKLEQQYAEATTEERDRLLPNFIRAIEKVSPGLSETADTRFFNGDYLKGMFDQCMQRALARHDLTRDRKTNAKEDAANFILFFDAAKQWPFPKLAAHAFEMATLALFTGLRAGLSPSEIDKLREEGKSKVVEPGWKASNKTRREEEERWKKWVTNNAQKTRDAYPTFTQADLADELIDLAKKQKISIPGQGSVIGHISFLEQAGLLSKRERPLSKRARPRG